MDYDMLYKILSTNDSNRCFPARLAQEDFKYYFYYVLFKRKWLIINVSILGMIATILGLYLITPLYNGSSKILVRSNVSQEVILFNDLYSRSASRSNTTPVNNFIEIATSHVVARIIVDKFKLDEKMKTKIEHPENFRESFWAFIDKAKDGLKYVAKYPYNLYQKNTTGEFPSEEEKDYKAKAIKKFIEDITEIDLVPESDIINLAIWGESPKECEAIVKAVTELVIEQSVAMGQNIAGSGYEFVRKELEKVREDLAMAEHQIQVFKRQWNISNIETQKEIKLNELNTVEKELISINAQFQALKAKFSEGKKQLSQQKKNLVSLQAYRDLQNNNILLEVDISALEAQDLYYQGAKEKIRKEIRVLVDKETELNRLKREAELKADLFDELGKKYGKLNVQSVSTGGFDLRIIDTPKLRDSMEADYPNWAFGIGIGIPSIVIFAMIFAFLLELQNESFWVGNQIENKLGIPLLGSIQFYKTGIQK